MGQVPGNGHHEVVGTFLGLPGLVPFAVRSPCVIDQLAQSYRSAARLGCEPIPVPGQQGYFAGDHSKFWPSAAGRAIRLFWCAGSRRCRCGLEIEPGQNGIFVAAQVDIDGPSGCVFEDQHRPGGVAFERSFGGQGIGLQASGGDPAMAIEGGVGGRSRINRHWKAPIWVGAEYYPGESRSSITSG